MANATILNRKTKGKFFMVPKNWRESLLKLAEEACDHDKIQETTLGGRIINDADFFPNLRKGKGCGVDRYIKIMNWFEKNLPKFKHQKSPKIINKT